MKSNGTVGQVLAAWSLGSHINPTPAASPTSSNDYWLLTPLCLAPQTLPGLFIPSTSDRDPLGRFGTEYEILRQEMKMLIPMQDWQCQGAFGRWLSESESTHPQSMTSMSWHGGCRTFEGHLLLWVGRQAREQGRYLAHSPTPSWSLAL